MCTWVSFTIRRILYIFKIYEDPYSKFFIALNVILVNNCTAKRKLTIGSSHISESGFNFQGYFGDNK